MEAMNRKPIPSKWERVRGRMRNVFTFMTEHLFVLAFTAALLGCLSGAPPVKAQSTAASPLATSLTADNLDQAAFVQWVDGAEKPLLNNAGEPRSVETTIWTTTFHFLYPTLIYGDSKKPGLRYLRIGFKRPVSIGSVLVHGGGQLSVLKTGAAYPGNLDDDSQWIPAQRLEGGLVTTDEVGSDQDALWVLPSVTSTRALRFTHLARASDHSYGGVFNGAYLLSKRTDNLDPHAVATYKYTSQYPLLLNDEKDNGWSSWSNIAVGEADRPKTIAEDPEWVMLTWQAPVTINGLASLGTGFSAADVQIYTGPAGEVPSLASTSEWKTVQSVSGWKSFYPQILQVHWIDLGGPVTTRAIRLRLTAALNEREVHPHLIGKTNGGMRVWLDELMALKVFDTGALSAAVLPVATDQSHAPIPISFSLPEDGFVTLVIDDSNGKRVRNLVADTAFPKGHHIAYWDGTDDLKRDQDSANHGLYSIPSELVAPGVYQVRGLWHRQVDLKYKLSIYSPGDPPWPTQDASGGWMTNHTPASGAVFIPAAKAPGGQPLIGIGASVGEGGSVFSWVNLDGKKVGGRGWIGGDWTGAQYLAEDSGPNSESNVAAYAASTFQGNNKYGVSGKIEIRVTKLTTLLPRGDQPVLKEKILLDPLPTAGNPGSIRDSAATQPAKYLGGLAVHNGILVLSETALNRLMFVDAKAGKILGEAQVPDAGALAFDSQGRLLVLAGKTLLRYSAIAAANALNLPVPEKLVVGLEDPSGITVDATGTIYVSDQGSSNQVKVFSQAGIPLRVIGHSGAPRGGPYDPLHMNHPKGLAVDSNRRIWVTEDDFQPKRVSVWNQDGTLWKAFYGPAQYGGGGAVDPQDASRFSYDGMEFHIDWDTGSSSLRRVYYRLDSDGFKLPFRSAPPEAPLYLNGRRYMTNAFNCNPTNGNSTAFLFLDKGDIVVPVAAIGSANDWEILKGDAFTSIWPTGVNLNGDRWKNQAMFIWSDLNGDGRVQPGEVHIWADGSGGVTMTQDGSFVVSDVHSGGNLGYVERFRPVRFTQKGVPVYSKEMEVLGDSQGPASDGGDQALTGTLGWTILSTAPPPYSPLGLGGIKDGTAKWSYPSLWPGLHASHSSPPPTQRGELVGTTRLLGDFVTPRNSDAGPLFFVNGNQGNIYVFTQDGLFVTQLFQDGRQGTLWEMPIARRDMLLNNLTLHDENFFPTVTQIPNGSIYLDSGALSALVQVTGLESIKRLMPYSVNVSKDDLKAALDFTAKRERVRQASQGTGLLSVALLKDCPTFDANPDSWVDSTAWASIDQRGVSAYFDSHSKPFNVQGTVFIGCGTLFALWKTGDPLLLRNSGAIEAALFKTGGALDLMIGTDPKADLKRTKPVAGDLRLLVSRVQGKTKAELFRALVPGASEKLKATFSDPWRSVTFDAVSDVSDQVKLIDDGKGDYEIAISLDLLGLHPFDGLRIKGDIGILRGNGKQTTQRVYWNNKGTAIVSDSPSEATLNPDLWGIWEFHWR